MEWEKLTHREHILKRPDTYVGSLEFEQSIGMSPGMYKIVDEILVNAFDEYIRDPKKMNEIHVSLSENARRVTVSNNKCIPVIMHPKENVYVPELIFGHLLTSSNYDDSKERYTGGRNGYGAKLTNIFSTEFKVTSCDPENGLEYTQTWRDNMSVCDPPKLKKYTKKTGWLRIEFVPDESKLGKMCAETLKRRAVEISLWGPRVKFNDELKLLYEEISGNVVNRLPGGDALIVKFN
jgi:DNA topoisomerase-2